MHPESGDHGAAPTLAAGSAVDGNEAAQVPEEEATIVKKGWMIAQAAPIIVCL
jgi:hypothetical protein